MEKFRDDSGEIAWIPAAMHDLGMAFYGLFFLEYSVEHITIYFIFYPLSFWDECSCV